ASGRQSRRWCGPASRKTSSLTPRSCASSAFDHHAFLPGLEPGGDAHIAPRHAIVLGEELDQRLVRFVIDRGCRQPDLDALAMPACKLRALRTRLHMHLEN